MRYAASMDTEIWPFRRGINEIKPRKSKIWLRSEYENRKIWLFKKGFKRSDDLDSSTDLRLEGPKVREQSKFCESQIQYRQRRGQQWKEALLNMV